jgi:hypothetical protein
MIEKNWGDVLAVLEKMHYLLVNRRAMILNITLDKKNWPGFERQIHQTLGAMPDAPISLTDWSTKSPPQVEGMTIPSQVNYVGKGANLFEFGYRFHGSALVITRYLRNSYLWDRIRVQGGAYGAFCLFDRLSGVLTFVSYRDPGLMKTIEAFDNTAAFLRDLALDDQELRKSIIGAIGDLDAYMLPDTKGYTSLLRYLSQDTEAMRQQLRDEVLATGKDDFRTFGTLLEAVRERGVVKVLGSPDAIDTAASDRPGWLNVLKVL